MRWLLNSKINCLKFIFSLLLLLPGALSSHSVFAVSELTLLRQEQKIVVDNQTITSWRRRVVLPKRSNLVWARPSLTDLSVWYFEQPDLTPTNPNVIYTYNPGAIYTYLSGLSQSLDTSAVEPELVILNQRAIKFTPPQDGLKTNLFASTQSVLNALQHNLETAQLIVEITSPKTKLADLNDLGIKELVARGESTFKGSPNNRRHNIKIGMEKMAGIILAPGEEFSFNKFLGPVEADQGFLPELVIKKDGTVPELGGGLCQVSSTTFRAAMAAGLPIKERKNHAYAVQYYAPQGTDATIYPGSVDLRFINDTPGSLLIWPYLKDKDHLTFDFYGTKDGREVTLLKPVQYDRKEDGSMKATWQREVTKNGSTHTDTFKSVYLSPALFHKEETFIKTTSTPAGQPFTTPAPAGLNQTSN